MWSTGCQHHKNDIDRGVVRDIVGKTPAEKTPNGLCHDHIESVNTLALATGNRSYGYTKTETARHAQYVRRQKLYRQGNGIVDNICATARELATQDLMRDPSGCLPFYGSVHDLTVSNAGDVSSVSISHPLTVQVAAEEVKGNPRATAVIDCTGSLVSNVWVSSASDLARRAREGRAAAPWVSEDGTQVSIDVLNFHLVFDLPTGPFVACEAVVVGKTNKTFHDVLLGFRRALSWHGPEAEHIKYFVSDLSVPFATAVMDVFNALKLAEYMAILIYSAKLGKPHMVTASIKSKLVWCDVHADRAVRNFAKKNFKHRTSDVQRDLSIFFRNLRMALASAKSYSDLCKLVGGFDQISSLPTLKAIP